MDPLEMDIDERIAAAFEKIAQVSRILLWEAASAEKLSPIQLQFLLHIDGAPESLRRVGAVAREFDLTPATVSDALSSLESKGLIVKETSEEDRRAVILSLTAKGRKTVKSAEDWKSSMIDALRAFPGERKEMVMEFLTGMIASLFARGILGSARICATCSNLVIMEEKTAPRFVCGITGRRFDESGMMIGCATHSAR